MFVERMLQMMSMSTQVAILRRAQRYRLELRGRGDAAGVGLNRRALDQSSRITLCVIIASHTWHVAAASAAACACANAIVLVFVVVFVFGGYSSVLIAACRHRTRTVDMHCARARGNFLLFPPD